MLSKANVYRLLRSSQAAFVSLGLLFGACGVSPDGTVTGSTVVPESTSSPIFSIQTPVETDTPVVTAGGPTMIPYSSPTDGSKPVLMMDDGSGLVVFGMQPAAFYRIAKDMGWSCKPKTNPLRDEPVQCGKLSFGFVKSPFDDTLVLNGIYVYDSSFQTESGLLVGDSIDKMRRLYGTDDNFDDSQDTYDTYFYILPSGIMLGIGSRRGSGKVSNWSMEFVG